MKNPAEEIAELTEALAESRDNLRSVEWINATLRRERDEALAEVARLRGEDTLALFPIGDRPDL